ncbi:MAG: sigma-54-dependent Fis family transcriptional regulator [Planctomycetes bacterium]|nr:sigma-54-dependent Fis family transcriptional regulator [Planctomycetota bacterium]
MKILLADDEESIRVTLTDDLRAAGHEVADQANAESAFERSKAELFDCLITDIRMPGFDMPDTAGLELVRRVKADHPDIAILVITGHGTFELAVEAFKSGARDIIQKPFLNEYILGKVEQIGQELRLRADYRNLRAQVEARTRFHNLIGQSKKMQEVYQVVETVAPSDFSVMIEGESGTGKELVSQAIHYNSPRKDRPMIKMSCAQFPETLLESELFGHERGAFTGAERQKIGRFEQANGGTIFIDDIDDMTLPTQVKLLRVLQEREIERLGGVRTIKVDLRVVVATKVDLHGLSREGRFREDLYYRLNVVPIKLPPLREREGDIPLLVEHFVQTHGRGRKYEISPETIMAMENYPWPGNVRELENAVARSIALAGTGNVLRKEHLIKAQPLSDPTMRAQKDTRPLREVVAESEKRHIQHVLEVTGGHKSEAARILGISRKNLWEKMREYTLE